MESPVTAERLMTPAAVSIAVGGFYEPATLAGFRLSGDPVGRSSLSYLRLLAISAADCSGRPREKRSLPDQTLWQGECAMSVTEVAVRGQFSNASMDMRGFAPIPANCDSCSLESLETWGSIPLVRWAIAGVAAVVLGNFASPGFPPTKLVLIALIELGCFSSLMGAAVGGTFGRAIRRTPRASAHHAQCAVSSAARFAHETWR
jgi:hypothetical protein